VLVLLSAAAAVAPGPAFASERWLHSDHDVLLGYGCTTFELEPFDPRFDCPPGWHVHEGIDFDTPVGTPVYAGLPGKVVSVGGPGTDLKDFGPNYVLLWLDEGHDAMLGHLSGAVVAAGQHLAAGSLVGYTGDLGETNVPNLHLEIRPHGGSAYTSVDAAPYLTLKHSASLDTPPDSPVATTGSAPIVSPASAPAPGPWIQVAYAGLVLLALGSLVVGGIRYGRR